MSQAAATIRSVGWLVAAQGSSLVLGFILWAYAARTLGLDSFGQTQLGVAVGTYLALLAAGGLNLLGISELGAQYCAQSYVFRIQAIRFAHTFAILAALTAAAVALPRALSGVIALCAASVVLRELWPEWVDIALGASRRVVLLRTVYFLVALSATVMVVQHATDAAVFGLILALAAMVVGVPAWLLTLAHLRRLRQPPVETRLQLGKGWGAEWTRTMRRALPLGAASALGLLLANADILILGALASTSEVAQYAAAYRIIFAIQGVGVALRLSSLKTLAEPGPQDGREEFERSLLKVTLLASIVVASVAAMVAPYLISLAYGESYRGSISLLRILVWTWPLDFACTILLNMLIIRGYRRRYVTSMAAAAAANLAANALVIPRFGASGAALVIVASLALLLVVVFWLAQPSPRSQLLGYLPATVAMISGLCGSFVANGVSHVIGLGLLALASTGAMVQLWRLYGSRILARVKPLCL